MCLRCDSASRQTAGQALAQGTGFCCASQPSSPRDLGLASTQTAPETHTAQAALVPGTGAAGPAEEPWAPEQVIHEPTAPLLHGLTETTQALGWGGK